MAAAESSSSGEKEKRSCFKCDTKLDTEKVSFHVCEKGKEPGCLSQTPICEDCAGQGRAKCRDCGATLTGPLKTPTGFVLEHLHQHGIVCHQNEECISSGRPNRLVVYHDPELSLWEPRMGLQQFRAKFYYYDSDSGRYRYVSALESEDEPETCEDVLEGLTGVEFKFDNEAGGLFQIDGEERCSERSDLDLHPATWGVAWAVTQIRSIVGPLNRDHVRPADGNISRIPQQLMRQGIGLGKATNGMEGAVSILMAEYILIAKEGPWFFYYPFKDEQTAEEVLNEWRWTDCIIGRIDDENIEVRGKKIEIKIIKEVTSRCIWPGSEDVLRDKIRPCTTV